VLLSKLLQRRHTRARHLLGDFAKLGVHPIPRDGQLRKEDELSTAPGSPGGEACDPGEVALGVSDLG